MTTDKQRNLPKWLRWGAILLLIAATPALWLMGRDAILLLRASEGSGTEAARSIVVDRFVQTIAQSKISVRSRQPLQLTLVLDPSCFDLVGGVLQPSVTHPAESDFREGEPPRLEEIFFAHRHLAEGAIGNFADYHVASENFSTQEAILFNACMAATPFSGLCGTHVSARLDRAYDGVFEEMAARFGIKLRQAGTPGQYCYTLPNVVEQQRTP